MSDFMTTLMLSHLRPYMVEKVIRGWETFDDAEGFASSAFVVRLVGGEYAYIYSFRDASRRTTTSGTNLFSTEPTHIYARAVNWITDEKVLNADLPFAKQNAKYPKEEEPADRGREGASCSRPGLRLSTA